MKFQFQRATRRKRLALVLLLFPLLSACSPSGGNAQSSPDIDAPPLDAEQAMLQEAGGNGQTPDLLTVYLLDRNGYVAPMTLNTEVENPTPEAIAEQAIAWMTEDKALADQLPPGFTPILPEGTRLTSVKRNAADKSMTLDFADPFPGLIAANERKMLEALVWTMTELPGIEKVKLTVDGRPLHSLPTSGMPVYDVLTRAFGINVEKPDNLQVNRSMAVTLYFSARSADGEGYFVPVTRLVERKPDKAKAALEQLIKGPMDRKSLRSVLEPKLAVDKVSLQADTVNVSLNEAERKANTKVPAEMMEALVLTMTEATGAPQVKVAMNGDDSFLDTNEQSYDHPVTRPIAINAIEH
jgi:germination protein M